MRTGGRHTEGQRGQTWKTQPSILSVFILKLASFFSPSPPPPPPSLPLSIPSAPPPNPLCLCDCLTWARVHSQAHVIVLECTNSRTSDEPDVKSGVKGGRLRPSFFFFSWFPLRSPYSGRHSLLTEGWKVISKPCRQPLKSSPPSRRPFLLCTCATVEFVSSVESFFSPLHRSDTNTQLDVTEVSLCRDSLSDSCFKMFPRK